MTNIFFFLSTKHIVSYKIHKINIYFFFFWQKDKPKRDKSYASVPMTQVSNLFRKVYFYEQIVESATSSNKGN